MIKDGKRRRSSRCFARLCSSSPLAATAVSNSLFNFFSKNRALFSFPLTVSVFCAGLAMISCLLFAGCGGDQPAQVEKFVIADFRNKLLDIEWVNGQEGWIVGSNGLILHTADSGRTWQRQESRTIKSLRMVSFVDTRHGWAVGGSGTILHTADGGATWAAQKSDTTDDLLCIKFIDQNRGFAGGVFATFLVTNDGGKTWEKPSVLTEEEEPIIPENISLEEKMKLLKEEFEAEEELEEEETLEVADPMINSIFFLDAQKGWIACEAGVIWHTADGGATWSKQNSGTPEDLFSIYFRNPQEGWATGLNGVLVHTADGGSSWQVQDSTADRSIFAISFVGDVGYGVGNAGTMVKSTDGGKTWMPYAAPNVQITSWLRDITSVDGRFTVVGGLGTILMCDPQNDAWEKIG